MEELTVSDWIAFLTAEKHGTMSTVLSLGSILLAWVVAVIAVKVTVLQSWWIAGIVLVIAAYALFVAVKPFQKREKAASAMLERIMRGCLTNAEDIRNEWASRVPVKDGKLKPPTPRKTRSTGEQANPRK